VCKTNKSTEKKTRKENKKEMKNRRNKTNKNKKKKITFPNRFYLQFSAFVIDYHKTILKTTFKFPY